MNRLGPVRVGEEFSSRGHKFLDSNSGGSRLYDEGDPTRIGGMWDAHIGGVCGGGGAAHHPRVFFGSPAQRRPTTTRSMPARSFRVRTSANPPSRTNA